MSLGIYKGEEMLCFGLDIGTTMSAVSFVHLVGGQEPRIRLVTRWPGMEESQGDCMVPTVVRYDCQGHAVHFGADDGYNGDDLEDTTLAKWFKLHLHPATMRTENQLTPPLLPDSVNIKTVYTDFLKFVFEHAQAFVNDTELDSLGSPLFDASKDNFVVVMPIANDWDDVQQAFLCDAVVAAGIFPVNHDRHRLQFVSEAEASIHFAVSHAGISKWLREGTMLAVCDAGDRIAETTAYRCESVTPRFKLEKAASSEYAQAGSVSVDEAARLFLQTKLAASKYGASEFIETMVLDFSRKTKRKFNGTQDKSTIRFGRNGDNDRPRVSAGCITLTCDEVKSMFKLSVAAIASSIDRLIERTGGFESLLLVGSFADSKYFRAALEERLKKRGVKLISIDEPIRKAVVEGSVAWFAKQRVPARAARATYGLEVHRLYDPSNPEHIERWGQTWVDSSGERRLGGMYSPLVLENEIIGDDMSTKKSYHRRYDTMLADLAHFKIDLVSIDSATPDYWCQHKDGTPDDRFRKLYTLEADLSELRHTLRPMTGHGGAKYLQVVFQVEIFFDRNNLCASLVWREGDRTRKSALYVIPKSIVRLDYDISTNVRGNTSKVDPTDANAIPKDGVSDPAEQASGSVASSARAAIPEDEVNKTVVIGGGETLASNHTESAIATLLGGSDVDNENSARRSRDASTPPVGPSIEPSASPKAPVPKASVPKVASLQPSEAALVTKPASVSPENVSQQSTMSPSTVHFRSDPPRLTGGMAIVNNNNNVNYNAPYGVINNYSHVEMHVDARNQLDDDLKTIEKRLERSHHVPCAVHDAHSDDAGCMEGTRAQFLASVKHLVTSRDGPHIIWIAGTEGSGKTSIALTLCRTLCEDSTVLLGGTFFCSRVTGTREQADARRIIPTFATLLVRAVPACSAALAAELRRDPNLADKSIYQQVQSLLVKPLNSLGSFEPQFVFVIDALDQCSDQRRVLDLANSLADFKSSLSVKFLVTSRPDSRIRESRACTQNVRTFIELHKLDVEQVTADIRLFIQKSFEISASTGKWYSDDDLDDLAKLSNGLFQFAVVAVGWILKSERSRLDRLERVKTEISVSPHSPAILDQMRSLMKS